MSQTDIPAGNPAVPGIYYDLAVPVFSFGGAALAILTWTSGISIDLRFTAAGCVIASFVLAYLAWIRPKKDIVALTTPIYAIIFFAVPLDDAVATIVLELLYAVSLSILLVRLKYRFGAPAATHEKGTLSGPLGEYVEKTQPACAGLPPAAAHRAAVVFLRYAAGEYGDVQLEARGGILLLDGSGNAPAFKTAFEILAEQAAITEKSLPRPAWYRQFTSADEALLARPLPPEKKNDEGYDAGFDAALDNALLLLFAAAWNASEADRGHLRTAETFATRVIEG
ncbi:hypothetical protein [Methanoregula sp.]|uniref:hypothetical protein n=1 Tax=Methanoregula sp. TaxID=2052170 RepID=UPI0025F54EFE|nr:hypothetical protein [Methanoregula sp.]